MNFEDVLPELRAGKGLYDSKFHNYIIFKDGSIVDDCGGRYEFSAEDFFSNHWNVVE